MIFAILKITETINQMPKSPKSRVESVKNVDRGWKFFITFFFLTLLGLLVITFFLTKPEPKGVGPKGTIKYSYTARDHQTGVVKYKEDPPVGGAHNPKWANCGLYNEPVPEELAVHSLEHGAVWLTYKPDVVGAELDKMVKRLPIDSHILISPNPGQSSEFVLTAWNHQLILEGSDDPRVDDFLYAFLRGPQTPEPGAPC
ncbi:MAG: DUF3105 domain-containing protein [Candidatus Paceibacterota bacterium]